MAAGGAEVAGGKLRRGLHSIFQGAVTPGLSHH